MHSQQINYFLSLCETLNFTKTASLFHVTQPVISRQIASLEEELGVVLFRRNRHRVMLTTSGEIIRAHFEKMDIELKNATMQARRASDSGRIHLSIRLLDLFDNSMILTAIGQFPQASFYVERHTSPCMPEELLNGRYDVGICFKETLDGYEGLEYREICRSCDCLLSAPDYLLQNEGAANLTLYVVSDDMKIPANFTKERQRQLERHGVTAYEFGLLPNLDSVLTYVESGLGITLIKDFSIPHLRFPHSSIPLDVWHSVGLAWHRDPARPYLDQFVETCFSGCKQSETNFSNTGR